MNQITKDTLFVLGYLFKVCLTFWLLTRFGEAELGEVKIAFGVLLVSWWMIFLGMRK